jgi:glutaredoxin
MESLVLEFYYSDTCPECQKVMDVLSKYKIKVDYIDIHDPLNNMQKLLYIEGDKEVPCLFVDGDPFSGSNDIIVWLMKNLNQLTTNA